MINLLYNMSQVEVQSIQNIMSIVQPFLQQVEVQEEAAALFPPEGLRTSGRCRGMPTPGFREWVKKIVLFRNQS